MVRVFTLGLLLLAAQVSEGSAQEWTGALKRIDEAGEIKLGFREAEPPMSFRDQSGNPVGYSVDLCGHIVAAVKQKLQRDDLAVTFVPVTAADRFPAIETGKIDILCGATTKTLGRSERVGFTQLTFVTGASLLSLEESKVPSVAGLKGKRVAVVSDTTTIEAVRRVINNMLIDAEVVAVATADEGMDLLDSGEVDAFASDQVVLIGQVLTRDNVERYSLSEELFSFEPFALAIPRGDPDFQLVADRALSQLNRSGQIGMIYETWFGRFAKEVPAALRALYQLNATPE